MMRMQLVELSQQKTIISSKKQYFKSEVPYICTRYKHAGMCGTKIKLKVWLQRTVSATGKWFFYHRKLNISAWCVWKDFPEINLPLEISIYGYVNRTKKLPMIFNMINSRGVSIPKARKPINETTKKIVPFHMFHSCYFGNDRCSQDRFSITLKVTGKFWGKISSSFLP